MFIEFLTIDDDGVVRVLFMDLNIYFFYPVVFLVASLGGFSIYLGNEVKYPYRPYKIINNLHACWDSMSSICFHD